MSVSQVRYCPLTTSLYYYAMNRQGALYRSATMDRASTLLKKRGLIRPAMAILSCCMATWSAMTFAQTIQPGAPYPVGMKQLEYVDAAQGNRHLALTLFYPAVLNSSAEPLHMIFFTNLHL